MCMYRCVSYVYMCRGQKGCQVTWSWSYGQLWAVQQWYQGQNVRPMCVLLKNSQRSSSLSYLSSPYQYFFLKKNMTGGVDGQTGRHTNSQTQERTQNCLPSFFSYKARTRERGQVGISWRRRGSKWWLSLRPKVLAHHTFCLASLYILSLQSPECAMALAH